MKSKLFSYLLFFIFLFTACSSQPIEKDNSKDINFIEIGNTLKIKNTNNQLTLLDNKEVLSADGLYYATWTTGNSEPYENSDGETVDLYDAQLYLLLDESKSNEDAQHNMDSWIMNAKTNYEILIEEEVSFNEQPYSLITYNFKNKDNPYSNGISAFTTFNNSALCIELTCRENFTQDLKSILTNFLNNCYYNAD